jgi:hypothetical protein
MNNNKNNHLIWIIIVFCLFIQLKNTKKINMIKYIEIMNHLIKKLLIIFYYLVLFNLELNLLFIASFYYIYYNFF